MQKGKQFRPKPLTFTYKQYEERGFTLKNLIIDIYVVYDLIGVGSYGSVYKGMNDETKRQVAVKVIDMRKIKNQTNTVVKEIKLRLAESEPKLMYMCDSDYLLKCYDVYENEDLKILIIEYCNGKTLQAEIDEKKRIPENQAWMILKHIINGLMTLHSYNIVHRDLKAENIMSHNGTYKIIDFGFSKKLQISEQSAEIRNTSLGTITTMAPEVMGRKPYGLKADIWSLGIIFFQMIYGVYPYDSVTAPQMYRQIQTKKLFNKPEPFFCNGYTPSKEAYNFLKFTVVVQTENRPDWKKVAEYPNIRNAGNDDLSQRFLKQCDVEIQSNLDYLQKFQDQRSITFKELFPNQKSSSEKGESSPQVKPPSSPQKQQKQEKSEEVKAPQEQVKQPQTQVKQLKKQPRRLNLDLIKNREHQQLQKKELQRKIKQEQAIIDLKEAEQLRIKNENEEKERKIRRETEAKARKDRQEKAAKERKEKEEQARIKGLNKDEARKKAQEVDRQDEKQYLWTQIAHLQCLKTQFVFREIIYPLEISGILKTEDRNSIEFYYLLSARCFNNMSPINDQLEERTRTGRNKELISNLKDQIKRLYQQIQKKFIDFSEKLTKSENQVGSRILDWFSKKINKQEFNEKDRFLTGIEKIEYTKTEQIRFTATYYKYKIREIIIKSKNTSSIIKRMDKYQTIMEVELDSLRKRGINFEEYVYQELR